MIYHPTKLGDQCYEIYQTYKDEETYVQANNVWDTTIFNGGDASLLANNECYADDWLYFKCYTNNKTSANYCMLFGYFQISPNFICCMGLTKTNNFIPHQL